MPTVNLGRVKPIHRGAYNGATTYQPLDYLTYNGVEYHCIVTSTGNLPTDTGFFSPVVDVSTKLDALNPSYTGTLTGGTGVVNLGSGQFVKDASGNVCVGAASPAGRLHSEVSGAEALVFGSATRRLYGRADSGGVSLFTGALQTGTGWYFDAANNKLIAYTNSAAVGQFDAAGNLGVGTTSITAGTKLDVNGAVYSRGDIYVNGTSAFITDINGGYGLKIVGGGSGSVGVQANGSIKAIFDAAGNFGLGVTPKTNTGSYKAFEIGTAGYLAGASAGIGTLLQDNAYVSAGAIQRYSTTAAATSYQQGNGAHTWLTAPSGTAGNPISFTQAMTLDASSNLAVEGQIYANGRGITKGLLMPDWRMYNTASGNALAWNNGTDKMTLDASGNLLVGTTSVGGKLTVNSTGGLQWFTFASASTASSFGAFTKGGTTTPVGYIGTDAGGIINGGTGDNFGIRAEGALLLCAGGGERARIDTSGSLVFTSQGYIRGGGSYELILGAVSGGLYQQIGGNYYQVNTTGGSTSDATLKKNVIQLESSLQKIQALRGVKFEYIEDQKAISEQGIQIGVIAQEVEAQFPEIVITDENGIKAVRYEKLIAPLIEAIKEQQVQIEALTTRISQLENN